MCVCVCCLDEGAFFACLSVCVCMCVVKKNVCVCVCVVVLSAFDKAIATSLVSAILEHCLFH